MGKWIPDEQTCRERDTFCGVQAPQVPRHVLRLPQRHQRWTNLRHLSVCIVHCQFSMPCQETAIACMFRISSRVHWNGATCLPKEPSETQASCCDQRSTARSYDNGQVNEVS